MSKIKSNIETLQALIDAGEVSQDVAATLREVIHDLRNVECVMQMMESRSQNNVVKFKRPGGVYKVDKIDHLIDRLEIAKEAHPLDINQQDLGDAHQFLLDIKRHPGSGNLGNEDYVVVRHPDKVEEGTIDSIRAYLLAYGDGQHSAESLRLQAQMTGNKAMNVLPDWFARTWGHTSKGGFAMLCYHTMIMSQIDPGFNGHIKHISVADMKELEDKLRNRQINSFNDVLRAPGDEEASHQ